MAINSQDYEILVRAKLHPSDSAQIKKTLENLGVEAGNSAKSATGSVEGLASAFNTLSAAANNVKDVLAPFIDSVFELNSAQIELAKVTDLSGSAMDKYTAQAASLGKEVAKSASEVLSAAGEFAKSGYSEQDALTLSKVALLYTNIADTEVDAAESASMIISQLKAFNIEAENSEHVIDAINQVANNFAVGTNDLSTALSKTSSAMSVLGNSFEETIGLVAAGTEIMQGQATKVARGLRTIGNNLADLANESGELEYKIGGATESLSLMDDATGDMKSTYQILSEIAQDWDKMSNAEQQALGISLAGRQIGFACMTLIDGEDGVGSHSCYNNIMVA